MGTIGPGEAYDHHVSNAKQIGDGCNPRTVVFKCQGDSNLPLPYRIPDQETPSRSSRPLSVSSHDKYSGEVESPVLCYISPITINIVISIDRADL